MSKEQAKGGPIPLSKMIAAVRWELQQAEKEGHGQDVRFKVQEVELELAVTVEHDEKVAGGFKVLVFEVGAEDTKKVAHAHRVKVKLSPQRGTPREDGTPDALIVTSDGASPSSTDDAMPLGQ